LASAWNSLLQNVADMDTDMLVLVSELITMIQQTVCLIGNASEVISQTRRATILETLDASWSKYEQEDFLDSKECLFGKAFQQTLTSKVEKESALAKALVACKCIKELSGKERANKHRRDNYGHIQFFQRSPEKLELQTIPCSKLTMLLECIRNLQSTITDSLRIADPIWGG